MARKKKSHKKHHRRHHRVGAFAKMSVGNIIGMMAATVAGMATVRGVNSALSGFISTGTPSTSTSTMNVKGIGLGLVEAGAAGWGLRKVKHPALQAFLVAAGAAGAVYALGSNGARLLPASIGYAPPTMTPGYRAVPMVGFPKPNNIGFPKPGNIGAPDRERARVARMYAGVYS